LPIECLLELIQLDLCSTVDDLTALIDFVCQEAEWRCWQTGVELKYLDYTILRVKEVIIDPLGDLNRSKPSELFAQHPVLYRDCENEFKCKCVSKQCAFVECYTSFKEFNIVKCGAVGDEGDERPPLVKILCNRKVCIKIYALIIEIIDTLLEDWYPDLGTRFMQDSKGDYLVTRLAPCSLCVKAAKIKSVNKKLEKGDKILFFRRRNLN
jgi:hypothetical protein